MTKLKDLNGDNGSSRSRSEPNRDDTVGGSLIEYQGKIRPIDFPANGGPGAPHLEGKR